MAFPTGWGRKCEITIPAAKITGNNSNFPVLLTKDNLPTEMMDAGANSALNGGGDIRFSLDSEGVTQLACEIVAFITSAILANRFADIRVLLPTFNSGADFKIWAWYKKAGETQPAVTDPYGRNAVYANFEFYSHDLVTDSTGNYSGAFAVAGNPVKVNGPFGLVDGAYDFDGTGDWIDVPLGGRNPFDGVSTGSQISGGAWLANDDTETYNRAIHVRGLIGASYASFMLGQNPSGGPKYFVGSTTNGSTNNPRVIGTADALGTWERVSASDPAISTIANGTVIIYQDAVADSTSQAAGSASTGTATTSLRIGARNDGIGPFRGKIAEVWFAKTLLTADFESTIFSNQSDPTAFASAGTPEAVGGGLTLTVNDATSGHTADNVTLTQAHSLSVNSGLSGHAADQVSLTQGQTIAVDSASHAHTSETAALSQAHIISVDQASHAVVSDSPALSQGQVLAPADATHSHTADNVTLSQIHSLSVSSGAHGLISDNVTLTSGLTLTPQDGSHALSSDVASLTQAHNLIVDSAAHGHNVDQAVISQGQSLTVNDATHGLISDSPVLAQGQILTVASAGHSLASDEVTLSQLQALIVANATHGLTSDIVSIFEAGSLISNPARTLVLGKESRTMTAKADDRTYKPPSESRTLRI